MREYNLWPNPVREVDGWITASATLEESDGMKKVLWYRIPAEYRDFLTEGCDPFVLGILFRAMHHKSSVRVHGRVSPSLIRNLEDFQEAWAAWYPKLYSRVGIMAEEEVEAAASAQDRTAIVAFSGGVDSSFTAFRHVRGIGTRFPRNLKAAVMVHGFDVPLEEPETFSRAFERSRRMTGSLGLKLIPMATNLREMEIYWYHSYGTALASSMMLLSGGYSEGLVGEGLAYNQYEHLPEGSNPMTDALLSHDRFRIIPDGSGFHRADKIRVLLDWPEFLENMRVCWSGPQKDRNCCTCEKCIRNILTFRALGQSRPTAFPFDVSDRQIRTMGPLKEIVMKTQYDNIVRLAKEKSIEEPWVKALQASLRRNRRRNRWKKDKVDYYLQRAAHYAVRPSALVFRLKHGHPPEEQSGKGN
jgi:hypothetical protein